MGPPTTSSQPRATAETVGREGQQLAQGAAESTKQVASTAKDEARNVAQEATTQAKDLAAQARSEVTAQADQQRHRLAGTLRNSGQELTAFADRDAQSQLTTELARRAGQYAQTIGDYLENADPQRILDDVRSFARRRPGTFLLIAAAGGVVAGRLTRSVAAAQKSSGDTDTYSRFDADTGSRAATMPPPPISEPVLDTGTTLPPAHVAEPGPTPAPAHVVEPGVSGRGGAGLADDPRYREGDRYSGDRVPGDQGTLP
jgi:hypothetical protein